jgi:hypothetical protein
VATLPLLLMRKVSLVRLLSKLAILAATASPALASPADRVVPDPLLICDGFIDAEHVDHRDAAALLGRNLAIALERMEPLEATNIASTWALSPDPLRRIGVARALEWQFPIVGADVVVDHLSRDPDPQIRVACARAAWIRRGTGGDPGVLDRLAHDSDPEVRAIAGWPR